MKKTILKNKKNTYVKILDNGESKLYTLYNNNDLELCSSFNKYSFLKHTQNLLTKSNIKKIENMEE